MVQQMNGEHEKEDLDKDPVKDTSTWQKTIQKAWELKTGEMQFMLAKPSQWRRNHLEIIWLCWKKSNLCHCFRT